MQEFSGVQDAKNGGLNESVRQILRDLAEVQDKNVSLLLLAYRPDQAIADRYRAVVCGSPANLVKMADKLREHIAESILEKLSAVSEEQRKQIMDYVATMEKFKVSDPGCICGLCSTEEQTSKNCS